MSDDEYFDYPTGDWGHINGHPQCLVYGPKLRRQEPWGLYVGVFLNLAEKAGLQVSPRTNSAAGFVPGEQP